MDYFVKEGKKERLVFRAKEVSVRDYSFVSKPLALRIVRELSKNPMCLMDLSRKLGEPYQKIYYYLKKLEKSGIIRLARKEERVGATAKIYTTTEPYVALKLYDEKTIKDPKIRTTELEFLSPFVKEGKLNALIVVGSPDPHGRFGYQASDGYAAIDLALFLGSFTNTVEPNYKLDTQIRETDLKKNLILIGGPKSNILVDKINKKLPIYFDEKREWLIVSKITGKEYADDEIGVVIKMPSPFYEKSWILFASGRRFKGTRASMIAIIKHSNKLLEGNKFSSGIARVVRGIDRDADGIIDDIEILE